MGQLIGHYSIGNAINKARSGGIGIVAERESNHYAIAGYFAMVARREQ